MPVRRFFYLRRSHMDPQSAGLREINKEMDLKSLAAEREARRAANPAAPKPASTPTRPSNSAFLDSAHRTIRIAHSLGCCFCAFGALLSVLIPRWWRFALFFCVAGVGLAKSGAIWLHDNLPAMYQEGRAPTAVEVERAASSGIFCMEGLQSASERLSEEWHIALENLAFACTYGKRKCVTPGICRVQQPAPGSKGVHLSTLPSFPPFPPSLRLEAASQTRCTEDPSRSARSARSCGESLATVS